MQPDLYFHTHEILRPGYALDNSYEIFRLGYALEVPNQSFIKHPSFATQVNEE